MSAQAQDGAKSKDAAEHLNAFRAVLSLIEKNYVEPLDGKNLMRSAIRGLAREVDPKGEYYDPQEFRDLVLGKGPRGGVGLEIRLYGRSGEDRNGQRWNACRKSGIAAWRCYYPSRRQGTRRRWLDRRSQDADRNAGTSVSLKIVREGRQHPFELSLQREIIRPLPVRPVAEGEIGYVRISAFQELTQSQLTTAMQGLKREIGDKLKGYIIDLRNNAGGLLDQAISATDAFLESGVIVEVRGRSPGDVKVHQATRGDLANAMPIIVLVNGGTAAGAEIMAAGLQDNGRARLVGSRTFGSGTIQTIFPLSDSRNDYGYLRLTTYRHYTPRGRIIEGNGLEPDIPVTQVETADGPNAMPKDKSKDTQLQSALALLRDGK